MSFISYSYFILFTVVMAARLTFGRRKTEAPFVALLIAASALLYAWHVPSFLLILTTSAAVDYLAGLYLGREPGDPAAGGRADPGWLRAVVLTGSLAVNLGLLFYFKYADFAIENTSHALTALGYPVRWRPLGVVLPMGISFYTFASLSYTIDVYRREIKPVRGFWRFFLFISFFPHLVAGPIVRASMFLPQIERRREPRPVLLNQGGFLIVRGLFLKVVCADNLSPIVNNYWDMGYAPGADSLRMFLLAFMFACQIFCDFEGYSSIAQGTAILLGYRLPLNFDNPYLASSFKNFWERWHITLSQWLRDYLYIPLGGNRGSAARTYANLMVVMLLGGLWHGASFTFVAWGALHGGALALERLLGLHRAAALRGRPALQAVWFVVVQAVVLVTWVLFRSDTLPHALRFVENMVSFRAASASAPFSRTGLVFTLPVLAMHARGFLVERRLLPASGPLEQALLAGFMLFAVLTCSGDGNAFIYFQF